MVQPMSVTQHHTPTPSLSHLLIYQKALNPQGPYSTVTPTMHLQSITDLCLFDELLQLLIASLGWQNCHPLDLAKMFFTLVCILEVTRLYSIHSSQTYVGLLQVYLYYGPPFNYYYYNQKVVNHKCYTARPTFKKSELLFPWIKPDYLPFPKCCMTLWV